MARYLLLLFVVFVCLFAAPGLHAQNGEEEEDARRKYEYVDSTEYKPKNAWKYEDFRPGEKFDL